MIALQAMSSFQALIGVNSEQDISIHLQVDDMERTFNTINKENALLLQSYEVELVSIEPLWIDRIAHICCILF